MTKQVPKAKGSLPKQQGPPQEQGRKAKRLTWNTENRGFAFVFADDYEALLRSCGNAGGASTSWMLWGQLCLLAYKKDSLRFSVSMKELIRLTGISSRGSLNTATGRLEDAGFVEVHRDPNRKKPPVSGKGKGTDENVYTLSRNPRPMIPLSGNRSKRKAAKALVQIPSYHLLI